MGYKCSSVSENEYRFLLNNMLFQLDSESIFEMMEDFPEFLIGTHIRGEGKMASPVLFNLVRLIHTRKVRREDIKKFVLDKMKTGADHSKARQRLKGSLLFVMEYIERYNQIKVLEEEGVKGVKKIRGLLEEDSVFVGFSRRSRVHYLVDAMRRFEKSLLGKRRLPVSVLRKDHKLGFPWKKNHFQKSVILILMKRSTKSRRTTQTKT